jgi:two-component system sensor histidine kinase RegB
VSPPGITVDRADVGLPWLVRLRWGALAVEALALAGARALGGVDFPVPPVAAALAAGAATNVVLARHRDGGHGAEARCGVVLALDVVLLTVLLHVTGGAWNPFSSVYLVYITLGAVVLRARWTTALAALAVTAYATLFLAGTPAGHPGGVLVHLQGMWVAFAVAATAISYFVVRLSAAIERRDAALAAVRDQAARSERLASLATLAAGAAHELGTPLATIAVAAGELERTLAATAGGDALDDVRLIRAELARCRAILDRMSADAGEPAGEAPCAVPLGDLVRDVVGALPPAEADRVDASAPATAAWLPRRAVGQALASLVRNALDATPAGGRVVVSVDARDGDLRIAVRDEGPGMTPAVLARAGEPFFSTKPAGRGLGLGLFLSRALAEQLGGRLVLESAPGRGATASLVLPHTGRDG